MVPCFSMALSSMLDPGIDLDQVSYIKTVGEPKLADTMGKRRSHSQVASSSKETSADAEVIYMVINMIKNSFKVMGHNHDNWYL